MNIITRSSRREFIKRNGLIVAATSVFGASQPLVAAGKKGGKEAELEEEDVSPAEDLMREHGVLKRVLLIYGESIRRIEAGEELSPDPVAKAARIIREFIEDYHEKLEENYLFPRFEKAGKLLELVCVLREQHQAGRQLTDITTNLATLAGVRDTTERHKLADSMRQFIRMYEPHEAREDTVLFPDFRRIVSKNEYDSLGEDFEKKEHELFGEDGFETMVAKVAEIEKTLDIHDLCKFTPKI
jgi:hemerythrin-like domain-containing protein